MPARQLPIARPTAVVRAGLELVRAAGPAAARAAARRRLWSEEVLLGLRCDLARLPSAPPARVDVRMELQDVRSFRGFDDEALNLTGDDAYEASLRSRTCRAAVESLYVANVDGAPVFAQWLVGHDQQAALRRRAPGSHSPLRPGHVLLAGAYTFAAFRGRRAMAAGMSQVLHIARDGGASAAFTYVAPDNVPSLRGCARVGFGPDHQRVTRYRLGRRRSEERPLDAAARAAWAAATG